MGNRVTVLENRTLYNIEIRMWVYPARPDEFKKILRIKPGRSTRIMATTFNSSNQDHDHGGLEDAVMLMVYANGGWTRRYILPLLLFAYAKVTCDRNQHGQVILRAKRANFNFFRLRYFFFNSYFHSTYSILLFFLFFHITIDLLGFAKI
mgnify:CR=1 FL=1